MPYPHKTVVKSLADHITDNCNTDKKLALSIAAEVFNFISVTLLAKHEFSLPYIGRLKLCKCKPGRGRNISTGQIVPLPSRWQFRFKASQHFRRKLLQQKKAEGKQWPT